jgi:HTH-type transcriptional regulator/antitoxin HigA
MDIRPIKSERDYQKVLNRIHELWGAEENTRQGDELEVLFTLVESFEKIHYPIDPPHPLEAIRFRLDQLGINEKELSKILGFRSRKYDIFNGKRKLSLNMIRMLHQKLKIPAEVLIRKY